MHKLVIERYALKNIAKINASHLPAIKNAIASLALHPRPHGYKKLKGQMLIVSVQAITKSFMKFMITS